MESLDDFDVKKIIHKKQSDVDTSDSQRQKTNSDSNSPDRITVKNKNNYKLHQPISTTTSPKSVNVKNKNFKKIFGQFKPGSYRPQKKQRKTSKFISRPSQKRHHPTDYEDESSSNKHCKSSTSCGSTMMFKNKQNNLIKSKEKPEIDLYDNSITAATNHIFNRSDKTQVAKEMCMQNILDEVEDNPISYTSFENVKEKKNESEEHKEVQPAVTSILSVASSTAAISSTALLTTPLVQSITPLMFDFQPSESKPIKEKENTNKTHLQFSFASPIVSTASSNETNHKLIYKANTNINSTHESINDTFTFKMPTSTKSAVILNSNEQHKLFDSNQPAFTFEMLKFDKKQSTPVMQFDAATINGIQPMPLSFRTTEESENTTFTPSLFGNNQKSIEKLTKPIQFKFCSSKPNNVSVPLPMTEPKKIVFRSSNIQNQNPFKKMDMSSTAEKSTLKLQSSAMPTSFFKRSNMNQSIDNQVFGNQISKNKQTTSGSDMCFANDLSNSVFQFNNNNSNSKPNDKVSEMPVNLFTCSSTQTASIFQASAPQHSGDKPVDQQIKQPRTQFSTPTFGSQSTTTFNFENNVKHVSSGSTFPFSNQPIQFTNNGGKKFGSVVPSSSNTFQLNSDKANNNHVKFSQTSNLFPSMPKFSGTESLTPQPTTTFSSVPPSQLLPFDSVASPTSHSFVRNRGFQFGNLNIAPSNSSTFILGDNSQPTVQDDAFSSNVPPTVATTSPFHLSQTASAIIPTPQFGLPPTQGGVFSFVSPPMIPNGIVYTHLFNPPVARPDQPFLQLLYYYFF